MRLVGHSCKEKTIMTLLKRHPLSTFFVLTYALSWWPWLLYTVHLFPFPLLATGPTLAALLMMGIIGGWTGTKALLLRLVQWRARPRWYAVILLLPLVIWGGAVMLNVLLGAPVPAVANLVGWPSLVLGFLLYLVNPLQGPLGEEPGWRGFALPHLQSKWSALVASLILSVFWAGWHLPLILSGQIPWPLLLSIIPLAILFTWVYNGTNGSLFIVLVFHASYDALGDFVFPLFSGPDLLRNYVLSAVVASVVALLVVIATGPARLARLQAGDDACRRSGGSHLKRRLVPFGKRQPIALGRENPS
jgi:membrane protease YdiL (CAAX protease family)